MEYNMSWFATTGAAPYLLATDLNDVMLNNVLEAPMLSDTPRSVSLMAGGGGGGGGPGVGAGDQTAGHDMAATVPQEFAEWGYQVSCVCGGGVGGGRTGGDCACVWGGGWGCRCRDTLGVGQLE